jgi:membrane protease YdiL (CAAX protease family)
MNAVARAEFARASRRRLWAETLSVYVSLEGALWTAGVVQGVFMVLTMALATNWTLSARRSWRELGLEPATVRGGWWIAPIGATIAGLILLGAWRWHTLRPPAGTLSDYADVVLSLIWALMQQFLAQSFFFLRLEQLLRSGRLAVIATALVFASAHIPNPVLVPVTLAGGLILSEVFRRYRTIYMLAMAHALVALSLAVSVPESILHDMRVGIGYILYRP